MSDGVGPIPPEVPVEGGTWLKGPPPDWSTIDFEVTCSRCGYNLRMLQEPRCPECGLQFHWGKVLQRAANRSPWLFEHQWRKRPVGSWFQTVRRSLRPRRFWSDVSIHDVIEPGPLWFLLLTAPAVCYMLLIAGFLCLFAVASGAEFLIPASASSASGGSTASMRIWMFIRSLLGQERSDPAPFRLMVYPAATLLAILVMISSLRQTLGRCRVRTVQILRVVAYMATPICLLSTALLMAIVLPQCLGVHYGAWIRLLPPAFLVALGIIPMVCVAAGLREYLGLTHARAVAVVSVLMAFLFIFTSVMTIEYYNYP